MARQKHWSLGLQRIWRLLDVLRLPLLFLGVLHPWKHISILDLRPSIPPSLDLCLVHLDHFLVGKIFIAATFGIALSAHEKQLLSQLLTTNLRMGT